MSEHTPRNMLATGCLGFIGSHFIEYAVDAWPKCQIVILDIMDPSCSSLKNVETAVNTGRVKVVRGDIRNQDLISHLLASHDIDTIAHLCANTSVDVSLNGNSLEFTSVNAYGSHVLLESVRIHNEQRTDRKVEKLLMVSTDEVYGSNESSTPLCEDAFTSPTNAYSASKNSMESICQAYIRSYKLPIVIVRPNNVMGIRQALNKLLPKFIVRSIEGKKLCIHGDGEQKRSFLACYDVARALGTVIEKGQIFEIYNVASNREYTVNEVTGMILDAFGRSEHSQWIEHVKQRAFQDCRYLINSSKLESLGWKPMHTLEDMLPGMIDWYARHFKNWWNVATIDAYLEAHPRM